MENKNQRFSMYKSNLCIHFDFRAFSLDSKLYTRSGTSELLRCKNYTTGSQIGFLLKIFPWKIEKSAFFRVQQKKTYKHSNRI